MLIEARSRLSAHPVEDVIARASGVILGKDRQIRLAMAGILARGHLLIEEVPGVGKTIELRKEPLNLTKLIVDGAAAQRGVFDAAVIR